MTGSIKFHLLFLISFLFLSGCQHFQNIGKSSQNLQEAQKEPAKVDSTENKSNPTSNVNSYLKYLYDARLNLALYNREDASALLTSANEVAHEIVSSGPRKNLLLEVNFAKKGFAKTPVYIYLLNNESKQISDIIKDLKNKNQELMSLSLVEPKGKLVTYEIIKLLNEANEKLKNADTNTPDYDFTVADRAIKDIYIDWQVSDYKKDIQFETKYHLNAAETLLNYREYGAASEAIDKAVESFEASYSITDFNSKNQTFVSFYENRIKVLKERLKKEKDTLVDGIIDRLM